MPRGHRKGFRWTTPEARFWAKVQITDGCWEWQGFCLPVTNHPELRGHGQIRIDGRVVLVHRYSYELHHGPIPDGLLICHSCDNPPCVRPDHLFIGTHADNTEDAYRKQRLVQGEQTCTAILTAVIVREIRARCVTRTESYAALGRVYGVNEATIRALVHRKTWRHLGDSEMV